LAMSQSALTRKACDWTERDKVAERQIGYREDNKP